METDQPGGEHASPEQEQASSEVSTGDDALVERFLSENPDWLYKKKGLLHILDLRADVHGATSLLEHQAQTLRQTNEELVARINELNDIAENNQQLIESLLSLCVLMCESDSAVDIYNNLQHVLPELYNIEYTQLIVHEQPHNGNFRLITPEEITDSAPGHRLLGTVVPKCSQIGEDECRFLFGLEGGPVRSAAIIPLRAEGRNYAVCCLGSEDPQRYHPGKDVVILDYISKLSSAALGRIVGD